MTVTLSRIVSRPYLNDDDFWRVRRLLIDAYPISAPGFNWDVRHWDGNRFHDADLSWKPEWSQQFRLWETADGEVVGLAHPDWAGSVCLQLHPDYRSRIEEEMLAWAVENLAVPNREGVRQLETFDYDYDAPRAALLEQYGFEKLPAFGVLRHMRIGSQPLPEAHPTSGYTLRTTDGSDNDCERMAALLNAAFNRTFHSAPEYKNFTTHSPSFRHDLNLVAEAADGLFAAHVGLNYEPANRYAIFEPVCTHPDHRRKHLAQTLMFMGLHKLKALGVEHVYVETGDMEAANGLYNSIGFTEAYVGHYWVRRDRVEAI